MTKRKNPFVRTKQLFYDDGLDIHWWVDEEDHKWFLDQFSDLEPKLLDERTINGKEYNEWMIGNQFGDYEGEYVDEDCPLCEHLLVLPDCHSMSDKYTPNGKEYFCSNFECDYENEHYKAYREEDARYWEEFRNKPESPKFREVGQTLEQFVERYKFGRFEKEVECTVCKRTVPVSDFYLSFGYAIISYSHEDCSNGGPSVLRPQGEKAKEWANLLGGS